jgi:hypothetical protein
VPLDYTSDADGTAPNIAFHLVGGGIYRPVKEKLADAQCGAEVDAEDKFAAYRPGFSQG